ncbi:MAG: dTMP kinase [Candidatus Cyclobacteriaceae bacterium M3_2C_046]
MKDKFFVFEGIDGSGKSTQLQLLKNKLQQYQLRHYITAEPTNSPIGSIIRNILNRRITASEETIATLFLADRLDHLQNDVNGLIKIIQQETVVISDRYYLSSYAYHSRTLDMDWVIQANAICAQILKPTVHFFIDISPEVSIKRIQQNRYHSDLFENLNTLKQVRGNYFKAFEKLKEQENIQIIDGERPADIIFADIWSHVRQELNLSE